MSYSIKVLPSQEFDNLPYLKVREAFGVTSPDKRNIYIRHTNLHDFNKMLIEHELDHLVEKVATDVGPNGERYFLGSLLGGLGKLAGGLFGLGKSAVGGIGNLLGGALGGITKGVGSLFKSPLNMFKSANPSGSLAGGLRPGMLGYGMLTPQQRNYQNLLQPDSGGGDSENSFGNSLLKGVLSLFAPTATNIGSKFLGIGLAKKFPSVPPLPDSVNQLRAQIQAGGSPLGQQAQGVISQNLSKQFQPLSSEELFAATAELDRAKLQDLRRLEGVYASSRPGTDYTTDTNYKRDLADLEQKYAEAKSNVVGDRTRTAEAFFNENQFRNIQAALGASDQQMSQLSQLAQLDVNQIMAQLQIDYASALNFKQVFQNLGGTLLLQGLTGSTPFFGFNSGA